MNGSPDKAGQPVALVIQRRIADDGFAAFAHWNGEVGEVLKTWPGFLGQEVVPPQPPAHVDWVTILRFASPAAARAWLQSEVRAKLIGEAQRYFVGSEDVHILPGVDSVFHRPAVNPSQQLRQHRSSGAQRSPLRIQRRSICLRDLPQK